MEYHKIWICAKDPVIRKAVMDDLASGMHTGFDLRVAEESSFIVVYDYKNDNWMPLEYINNKGEKFKNLIVPTGIKWATNSVTLDIEVGKYLAIAPRSGLSLKTGLRLANAVGTVESSYRNEIGVLIDLGYFSQWLIPILNSYSRSYMTPEMVSKIIKNDIFGSVMVKGNTDDNYIELEDFLKDNFGMMVEQEYSFLFTLKKYAKIAQAIPIGFGTNVSFYYMEEKSWDVFANIFKSNRGENGYGSTGV